MRIERGIIIIIDLSGYTSFVKMHNISILHAEWAISELMKSIAKEFSFPVKLNKLEGDAAVFFAPVHDGNEMEVIKQVMRQSIKAFREFKYRRDYIVKSNICFCGACPGLQAVKLKSIFHLGEVVVKKLLNLEELAGDDIIIAHRLLKNTINFDEYFLMTEKFYEYAKNIIPPLDPVIIDEDVEAYGKVKVVVFYNEELENLIGQSTTVKGSKLQGALFILHIWGYMIKRLFGIEKQKYAHLPR